MPHVPPAGDPRAVSSLDMITAGKATTGGETLENYLVLCTQQ